MQELIGSGHLSASRQLSSPSLMLFVLSCLSSCGCTIRSVTVASPRGPSADEAAAAAAILQADGVVVIKCEELERLAPPLDNARAILAGMIDRVDRAGINCDQPFSYAEICHRAPRRYDVHLGAGTSESEFSTLLNSLVWPVLACCSTRSGDTHEAGGAADVGGRIIRDGLVTSLPGASAQPFHADGRAHGLYNAFLPLVPVRTQGTEFWTGSHHDETSSARIKDAQTGKYVGESILDDAEIAPLIRAPQLERAEGIILFDYRVIHRGRAHDEAHEGVRPVFYRVYAIDDAAEDVHNWPERTLPV